MKNKNWIVILLPVLMLISVGCQKAKMKTVPRVSIEGPAGVGEPVEERRTPPPTVQPPVVTPEPPGTGEDDPRGPIVGMPDPEQPRIQPPTPRPPQVVTRQPELPPMGETRITWIGPGVPPAVLGLCPWEDCSERDKDLPPPVKKAKPIHQRAEPITNKLDVLFVVDTSNSLDDERNAVVNNLNRFTDEISKLSERNGYNKAIDFQMGVILAHGPKSATGAHGQLFVHPRENSGAGKILTSNSSVTSIKSSLRSRFNGGPSGDLNSIRDRSSAQGEVGILSLETYLRQEIDLNSGFPRDDAALMVIFVSDENDVCYDYQGGYTPQSQSDDKLSYGGVLRDRPEHEAFIDPLVCAAGKKGQSSIVANLLARIKNHSAERQDNLPLITRAVVYGSVAEQELAQQLGKSNNERFYNDNEMGHGYIDLVLKTNGEVSSLSSADFGKELADAGQMALFKMTWMDQVPIIDENNVMIDLSQVDVRNISVEIQQANGETVSLISGEDFHVSTNQISDGGPIVGTVHLYRSTQNKVNWAGSTIHILY